MNRRDFLKLSAVVPAALLLPRWLSPPTPLDPLVINVMDYGAGLDRWSDDTAAIQRAMDAACKTSRPVWFPKGTYNWGVPR